MIKKLIFAFIVFFSAMTCTVQGQEQKSEKVIKVEKDAEFPGGSKAWANFLGSKIDSQTAEKNGAHSGTYTVIVINIVSADCSVTGVKAETAFGYQMENAAKTAISKSPKWKPAVMEGKPVSAYRRQPIIFVVPEQKNKNGRGN